MMLTECATWKYSAVIVLAHHMNQDGTLNTESAARLHTAIEAFKQKETPLILTCGWPYRDDSQVAIAVAMRNHALKNYDIPGDAIEVDTNSRDTVGDAIFSKRNFAAPRNWNKILVVTSQYHTRRTFEIFSFVYGPNYLVDVRGAPVPDTESLVKTELSSTIAFRKTFDGLEPGKDEAIFDRLSKDHPFYNGSVYPRI